MFTVTHISHSATGTAQDTDQADRVAVALYGPVRLWEFQGNTIVYAPVGHRDACDCGDCDECDNA